MYLKRQKSGIVQTIQAFAGSNWSVAVDIESSVEDVVEVSIEQHVTEKVVALHPFELQTYKREETLLTTFQVNVVQSPLRADRQ